MLGWTNWKGRRQEFRSKGAKKIPSTYTHVVSNPRIFEHTAKLIHFEPWQRAWDTRTPKQGRMQKNAHSDLCTLSSPPLVQRTLRCILCSIHPPKASCFAAVQVHAIVICVTIRGARACFRRLHPPIFPQIDLASLAWSEAILLEMALAILLRPPIHGVWRWQSISDSTTT